MMKKIRKCPPRWFVCCTIDDPKHKDSKICQTTIYWCTFLVSLCTRKKGNRKSSCGLCFLWSQMLSWSQMVSNLFCFNLNINAKHYLLSHNTYIQVLIKSHVPKNNLKIFITPFKYVDNILPHRQLC